MAKLSASALRTAAANAREKSAENAVLTPSLHSVTGKHEESTYAEGEASSQRKEPTVAQATKHQQDRQESYQENRNAAPEEKHEPAVSTVRSVLRSYEGERKTEHVNLLITPSLSRKIEFIQKQGEFRSKNAAVIAVLEAFCDANDIK